MMRHPLLHSVLFTFLAALGAWLSASSLAAERPNVVLIMTDNQGAWTLGCYGNQDIRTPNIDRLAADGIRFTRSFSSNAVCSPTRATYLTGLLPSQHGVHCYLGAEGAQVGPKAYNTIGEFRSLSKVLADAGYVCGLSGKWHLGDNLHPQDGFSDWITMPVGSTSTFDGAEVIEDGKIRVEPRYLTDLWTERGVRFIKRNRKRPFFLFLAYNGPYGLSKLLLRPTSNRHFGFYEDKLLPSFPREEMHPWLFNNKEYLNNIVSIRRVAAETSGVDDGVGQILATLKQCGLERKTLVIFCADQGWLGGQHGLWGMGDHTRPLAAFDGMLHVPLVFAQPGSIAAGQTADIMTSNYDFMPTVLGYLGLAGQMPKQPQSPGRDYSWALRGREQEWDNTVFYDFENVRAVRTPSWKYVERFPDGPHELYDLEHDSGEQFNLFGQPQQAERQRELRKKLFAFFDNYADPKFDLWRGGRSKTELLSAGGAYRLTTAAGKSRFNDRLTAYIGERVSEFGQIAEGRKAGLKRIAQFVRRQSEAGRPARLVFICTHNSRRSHMAQIWAANAASYDHVSGVECFSGGTEATAFNPRAIATLERAGFEIQTASGKANDRNPRYRVQGAEDAPPLVCFSKKFDAPANPKSDFCAVFTCAEADKSCPTIAGATLRVAIPFDDPKAADGSPQEAAVYDERCAQIAREMLYVFSQVAPDAKL